MGIEVMEIFFFFFFLPQGFCDVVRVACFPFLRGTQVFFFFLLQWALIGIYHVSFFSFFFFPAPHETV